MASCPVEELCRRSGRRPELAPAFAPAASIVAAPGQPRQPPDPRRSASMYQAGPAPAPGPEPHLKVAEPGQPGCAVAALMDGVSGGQGPPQPRLGEAWRQGRKDRALPSASLIVWMAPRYCSSSAPVKCGAKAARASFGSDCHRRQGHRPGRGPRSVRASPINCGASSQSPGLTVADSRSSRVADRASSNSVPGQLRRQGDQGLCPILLT